MAPLLPSSFCQQRRPCGFTSHSWWVSRTPWTACRPSKLPWYSSGPESSVGPPRRNPPARQTCCCPNHCSFAESTRVPQGAIREGGSERNSEERDTYARRGGAHLSRQRLEAEADRWISLINIRVQGQPALCRVPNQPRLPQKQTTVDG